jgi:choline-sulfatase
MRKQGSYSFFDFAAVRKVYDIFFVSAAALAIAACHSAAPAPNAGLRSGELRGADVLLVTIDTLRADHIGAYGGRAPTPTLDALAARGVRFTHAYAHAPMTLPAHTSIMTGLLPVTHGVHVNSSAGLDAHVPTLAEQFRRAGYRTAAFVGAFVLDARVGLARGFDVYDDRVGSDIGAVTFGVQKRTADRVLQAAAAWILGNARQPAPFFVWIHLFDPHAPYRAPVRRVADPYDDEIAFADAELGGFLGKLRETGRLDRTLIVALADHGESLGEHGEMTHGLFAYESTLRIPLILAGPSIHPDVSDEPIAEADVLPTILDLAGIEMRALIDGRSILPALRHESAARDPIYFEALDAYLTRNWAPLTGLIAEGWKYIDLPEAELYNLDVDAREEHNLAGRESGRAAALQQRLARWNAPAAALASPLIGLADPDAAARLRSLGYAAVQAPAGRARRFTIADDPKRLVDLDRRYERALTITGDGRYAEAASLLRSVVAERPDFAVAYNTLASVLIQGGQPRDAVKVLEDAARKGVSTPDLQARLGSAYLAVGDAAQAAAALEPLAARGNASVDALNTLAIAYAQLGRRAQARQLFTEVLQRSPDSATTWNNLGLLELSVERPREAARAFERAVAADPQLAQAWQALGAARVKFDPAGAVDAWRRAVELAPRDYDLLFNLAAVLHQQGKTEEARPYAERFVREAPPSRYHTDIDNVRRWLK